APVLGLGDTGRRGDRFPRPTVNVHLGGRRLRGELQGEGDVAALDGQSLDQPEAHDVAPSFRVLDAAESAEDCLLGHRRRGFSAEKTHRVFTIREGSYPVNLGTTSAASPSTSS